MPKKTTTKTTKTTKRTSKKKVEVAPVVEEVIQEPVVEAVEPVIPQVNEQLLEQKEPTKEEKKLNTIKKILTCIKNIIKIAVSRGNATTVWYKKGLYYTGAVILFVLTYVIANHGIEIIDWLTSLVQNLF